MAIFRIFKMAAAAAIMDFSKCGNFTGGMAQEGPNASSCHISQRLLKPLVGRVKKVKVHHRAKFCGDRSNRCRDMASFQFRPFCA